MAAAEASHAAAWDESGYSGDPDSPRNFVIDARNLSFVIFVLQNTGSASANNVTWALQAYAQPVDRSALPDISALWEQVGTVQRIDPGDPPETAVVRGNRYSWLALRMRKQSGTGPAVRIRADMRGF